MQRTTTWLWVLGLGAVPLASGAGCGDDTSVGGGGAGGATTSSVTTSTSSPTTTTSTASMSSSSSTGGAGGGEQFADACPGPVVSLAPGGAPVTLVGTTAGQTDDYKTYCGDVDDTTSAPDVVVQLEISAPCTLEVALTDVGAFDGVLSLRHQACDMRLGNDFCYNDDTDSELAREHVDAGTHFVVVDGALGTEGDFALTISCTAPVCGDGVQNPGEQCDYLPVVANDGCGDPGAPNECQGEGQVAADDCPGTPVAIDLGEILYLPPAAPLYSSADAVDHHKGTCIPGGENGGKDEVFAVTPNFDGVLTATVGEDYLDTPYCLAMVPECWANYVYAREADCTAGTEVACMGYDVNGVSQTSFMVTAGTTYFVFVDGLNDQSYAAGPYVLRLELN